MPGTNPIEKRLKLAADAWEELLADENARLGRFVGTSDDKQLFETFLETESDEHGQLPDLFLRFNEPFERPDRYVLALIQHMQSDADRLRQEPASEASPPDLAKPWRAPQPQPGMDPVDAWMAVVIDYAAHYGRFFEAVGIYLEPSGLGKDLAPGLEANHAWMKFLYAIARHPKHPATVRHMVWDDKARPGLGPLADTDKVRVFSKAVDFDMPGAIQDLAQTRDDGSAGGAFRKHFTALAMAGGKGDVPAAQGHAQKALAITSQEKWPSLEVAVHMAMAATQLGAKDMPGAYATYDKAEKAAQAATAAQDPAGAKLEVQALAGKASTRIAQADFQGAGTDYEIMAQKAEAQGDDRMTLEGWRMAAYCRECLKDWDGAYDRNAKAVKIAERMKPEDRENSTLPYVGQAFTRITQKTRQDQARPIKAYMDKLMPGWEAKIQRRAETA